ncbi:MAG TPA: ATP-binding protein [Thermoanaerobaculia bacterium]|nr:ATP-binding protein [Thermoanaerobaculia bacterium]
MLDRARRRVSAPPLRRVAVAGPESSGKTTLAASLARHFGTVFVPEASRAYYDAKGVVYEIADILPIARAQSASEEERARTARGLLVLDTDLLTITIWSHVLYGGCPPEAEAMAAAQRIDLTLLLAPDLPWTYDPQRCHPKRSQREDFHGRLQDGLTRLGRRFTAVGGDGPERFAAARAAVDALLAGG